MSALPALLADTTFTMLSKAASSSIKFRHHEK